MTTSRAFGAFCAILIVAALAVTLSNTSEYARFFEPNAPLAWAWACFVDAAIGGFTLALALGKRSRVLLIGFVYFVILSLVANTTMSLARYDAHRGAQVIARALESDAALYVLSLLHGVSIPLAVYVFAHTMAEALRCAPQQNAQPETTPATEKPTRAKRGPDARVAERVDELRIAQPHASQRAIAKTLADEGITPYQVRQVWGKAERREEDHGNG